ncbi:MAG: hypothetical protein DBP02_10100 [gamma proteobacterium symbiont of Ctena orbiculata]|nr:MAG: hypothetical protein DBP02_10100 [gamma proteobacterium symbiont of Ctena orbiculata]
MLGVLATAVFTGGIYYKAWSDAQPEIDCDGEASTEKECKISFKISNPTRKVQSINSISVVSPSHSVVCSVYDRRGKNIPERHHYQSTIDPRVKVEPENERTFGIFVSKGIETAETLTMELGTSWSKYPFIKQLKHRIKVEC